MSGPASLSAETIGSAARFDPQLRVPARPRTRRGLHIEFHADEVVVTGGPKRQVLRGRSASTLLPPLLAALDGKRDHADLAHTVDVPVGVVFKALSLLWACGVIEEACPDHVVVEVGGEVADLLSRLGDSTGTNDYWEQAALRLRDARIEVFGDARPVGLLVDQLGSVLHIEAATSELPHPATTVVVHIDRVSGAAALTQHCWDKGVMLLQLRFRGRHADIGPLVDPRMTPCHACLTADDVTDERQPVAGDEELGVSLLARDLFAVLSRATPSPLPTRWRRLDLDDLRQVDVTGASRPGCENCSVAPEGPTRPAPLAAHYEASVAMPPKAYADLKAHQMHYKPSNLALQQRSRTWPVAPRVPLPGPDLQLLKRPWPDAPAAAAPSLDDVSALLKTVAGTKAVTGDRVRRWTASGGNIGSVTAYVVARDLPGLPGGIYGYVLGDHRLARLSTDTRGVVGTSPVTVVLTGDFRKVAQKYGAFALRIVLLDSGCAQATAAIVCATLGIDHAPRARWDDTQIAGALSIDPGVEPITAVLDLGGPR